MSDMPETLDAYWVPLLDAKDRENERLQSAVRELIHHTEMLRAEIESLRAALRVANDALAAFCSHQLNHAENYALLGDAWKQTRAALEGKP